MSAVEDRTSATKGLASAVEECIGAPKDHAGSVEEYTSFVEVWAFATEDRMSAARRSRKI